MKFTHQIYTPPAQPVLLPPGTYPFKIIKAEEKDSKSGNHMVEIYVRISANNNMFSNASDWFLDEEKSTWKRKHLLESIGKGHLWSKHELNPSDLIGETGTCVIGQKPRQDGKIINSINNYIVSSVQIDPGTQAYPNDSIPF